MSTDRQRLIDYLAHMLQAVERITRFTEELDEVVFLRNELIQDAVIRNLEILGEVYEATLQDMVLGMVFSFDGPGRQ